MLYKNVTDTNASAIIGIGRTNCPTSPAERPADNGNVVCIRIPGPVPIAPRIICKKETIASCFVYSFKRTAFNQQSVICILTVNSIINAILSAFKRAAGNDSSMHRI